MSDLISRSEAVQRLIQETVDSKNNLIHINTVKRLLQDVDTAYDIDKINKLSKEQYKKGYADGSLSVTSEIRNKAIDDFKKILTIEKIKEYAESDGFINLNNCSLMIFDIAEQLKAGGENE